MGFWLAQYILVWYVSEKRYLYYMASSVLKQSIPIISRILKFLTPTSHKFSSFTPKEKDLKFVNKEKGAKGYCLHKIYICLNW